MNHMQVVKTRRRLSSKTRYLWRSPRPRGKRRECGTGTKAADLSRIKNIPLWIFLLLFFPNRPLQKVLRGSREALSAEATVLFLCHYAFKSVIKMMVHLDKWLLNALLNAFSHHLRLVSSLLSDRQGTKTSTRLAFLVRCCWSRDRTCSSESSAGRRVIPNQIKPRGKFAGWQGKQSESIKVCRES